MLATVWATPFIRTALPSPQAVLKPVPDTQVTVALPSQVTLPFRTAASMALGGGLPGICHTSQLLVDPNT